MFLCHKHQVQPLFPTGMRWYLTDNTNVHTSHCWAQVSSRIEKVWTLITILAYCRLALLDTYIWYPGYLTMFFFTVCQWCLIITKKSTFSFDYVTLILCLRWDRTGLAMRSCYPLYCWWGLIGSRTLWIFLLSILVYPLIQNRVVVKLIRAIPCQNAFKKH